MNYPSNCIKLRELCIPLYTNYLIANKKFPVTKFTPRKKGSGIIYYIKLNSFNSNSNKVTTSSVLSSDTARANKTIASHALGSESERELFKIGYTSRTITHRLTTMEIPTNIKVTVIATLKFRSVTDAYNMEQVLHKEFKYGRYYGKVLGNGNSELYGSDVLGLVYS